MCQGQEHSEVPQLSDAGDGGVTPDMVEEAWRKSHGFENLPDGWYMHEGTNGEKYARRDFGRHCYVSVDPPNDNGNFVYWDCSGGATRAGLADPFYASAQQALDALEAAVAELRAYIERTGK